MISIDDKMEFLRAHVQMGHTAGTNSTANTCFTPWQPDFLKFMKYDDVVKIIKELEIAALTGSLDTTQKYMYWFLNDNNIITAFIELGKLEAELEKE